MTADRGRKSARRWVVGTGTIGGIAILGALVIGSSAKAGKSLDPCVVTYGSNGAYGAMGAARDANDGAGGGKQLVHCEVVGVDSTPAGSGALEGGLSMLCVMIDASGQNPKSCVSNNHALIGAAQAVGDSKVILTIKAGSPPNAPECGSLTVINSSEYSPKTKTP